MPTKSLEAYRIKVLVCHKKTYFYFMVRKEKTGPGENETIPVMTKFKKGHFCENFLTSKQRWWKLLLGAQNSIGSRSFLVSYIFISTCCF